jgi:hypothetical protein
MSCGVAAETDKGGTVCRYLITLIMLSKLVRNVDVVPPGLRCLKFRRFLGCGEHLHLNSSSLLVEINL